MRIIFAVLLLAFTLSKAIASDIGQLSREKPEWRFSSTKSIFEIERCIIEIDGPGIPSVYRQPDRLDRAQIAYSIGTGVILFVSLFQHETGSTIEIRRGSIGLGKKSVPEKLMGCF